MIIYKVHSPSLVHARSQEELESVFAGALCYTDMTGASVKHIPSGFLLDVISDKL
jgi:hypothetical protein